MLDATVESEAILYRFNRLIRDLLRGTLKRNTFQRWEIDILLDIDACQFTGSKRREMLRRYQRAVERQLERGGTRPMKFSDYVAQLQSRRPPFAGEHRGYPTGPSPSEPGSAAGGLSAVPGDS